MKMNLTWTFETFVSYNTTRRHNSEDLDLENSLFRFDSWIFQKHSFISEVLMWVNILFTNWFPSLQLEVEVI